MMRALFDRPGYAAAQKPLEVPHLTQEARSINLTYFHETDFCPESIDFKPRQKLSVMERRPSW
jgi:hypothetical protein